MTSWSAGHLMTAEAVAHSARVAEAVERQAADRRTRGLVASGLMRGHFTTDGQVCSGHFASEHTDAAGVDG